MVSRVAVGSLEVPLWGPVSNLSNLLDPNKKYQVSMFFVNALSISTDDSFV